MKKFMLLSMMVLGAFTLKAQMDVVDWMGEVEVVEDQKQLVLTASIEQGWYVYSQFLEKGGPVATKVTFDGESVYPVNEASEVSDYKKEGYDDVFEMNVVKFGNEVQFVIPFEVSKNMPNKVSGTVLFMSCNDEMCLPPKKQRFVINMKDMSVMMEG